MSVIDPMRARNTLLELSCMLDERGASMTIHCGADAWIVWLYAPDDPACFFSSENTELSEAIASVLSQWDGASEEVS